MLSINDHIVFCWVLHNAQTQKQWFICENLCGSYEWCIRRTVLIMTMIEANSWYLRKASFLLRGMVCSKSSGGYLSATSVPLSRSSCLRCLSRQPCHLGSLLLQERLKHIVTVSGRSWCFPMRWIDLVTQVFFWNVTKELLTRYPLRLVDTHSIFASSSVVYLVLTLSSLLDPKI